MTPASTVRQSWCWRIRDRNIRNPFWAQKNGWPSKVSRFFRWKGLCRGQGEGELAANGLRGDHVDVFPVGLNDLPDDGQAKARALFIPAPGGIGLIEAVPDLLQALLGDAAARVLDGDEDLLLPGSGADIDGGIRIGKLDGVVDEVIKDLLDLPVIRKDHLRLIRKGELKVDVLLLADPLIGGADLLDHAVDVKVGPVKEALGIQGIQGQHPLRQLRQPLRLGDHPVEVFVVHLRGDGAVQDRLQVSLDGGQGRTEVMGHIGNEALLIVLQLGELPGHVVQGVGQIAHLVLHIVDGDPVVQVPVRVLHGSPGDLL